MSFQTTIPCPVCQTDIPVDSILLLSGKQFKCPNESCSTCISLDSSSIARATEAFDQFEALKESQAVTAQSA